MGGQGGRQPRVDAWEKAGGPGLASSSPSSCPTADPSCQLTAAHTDAHGGERAGGAGCASVF